MARMASAAGLAVALLIALVPASAQLPVAVTSASAYTVVSVQVPISPASGAGTLQIPVDDGVLEIAIEPVMLPGPGGEVDVGAYIASARLLLPSGVAPIPLPTMVIQSQDSPLSGDAADQMDDLTAGIADLRAQLDEMASQPLPGLPSSGGSDPEPDPQPEPEPAEPLADELAALDAQLGALAAQAAFVQAFADEAAAVAGSGIGEQVVIANAMLRWADAGLALVDSGLSGVQGEITFLQAQVAAAAPSSSPAPSSNSSSPSSSPSSSTSSSSAPPSPGPADDAQAKLNQGLAPVLADLDRRVARNQERVADLRADARAARQQVLADASEASGDTQAQALGQIDAAFTDAVARQQAALDGANAAAAMGAAALAELQQLIDANVAQAQGQAAPAVALTEAEAAAAAELVDGAVAHFQWVRDWVGQAAGLGSIIGGDSLAAANASAANAERTSQGIADLLSRYANQAGSPVLAELDALVAQARSQADSTEMYLDYALGRVGSAPGMLDSLPQPEGAVADDALAVCIDSRAGQAACLSYASLVDAAKTLEVLVEIPAGLGGVPGVPLPVPLPTGEPSVPPVPIPTLPGLGGASSSSSSAPAPPSAPPSGGTTSSSPTPSSSAAPSQSTSQDSTDHTPGAPDLRVAYDPQAIEIPLGEQQTLTVTVSNVGDAADVVHLTALADGLLAVDTTDAEASIGPGEVNEFIVRLTPQQAGDGSLKVVVTGDEAGHLEKVLAVSVLQAAQPAASITASIDPTAVRGNVGEKTPIKVRIVNEGSHADRVDVSARANGIQASPGHQVVDIAPGSVEVVEVWLTPDREGPLEVAVRIASSLGAALQPLVLVDAQPALASDASSSDGLDDEAGPIGKSKDSPTPTMGLLALALVGAALAARRRRA